MLSEGPQVTHSKAFLTRFLAILFAERCARWPAPVFIRILDHPLTVTIAPPPFFLCVFCIENLSLVNLSLVHGHVVGHLAGHLVSHLSPCFPYNSLLPHTSYPLHLPSVLCEPSRGNLP